MGVTQVGGGRMGLHRALVAESQPTGSPRTRVVASLRSPFLLGLGSVVSPPHGTPPLPLGHRPHTCLWGLGVHRVVSHRKGSRGTGESPARAQGESVGSPGSSAGTGPCAAHRCRQAGGTHGTCGRN